MRHTLSRERCTTPPTHDDNSLDAGGHPDGPDKRHRRRSHNTPLARSWTCQIAGGSHGRHFYVWCAGAPTLILAPAGPACGLPATQRSCGGTWPIALTRWRWALPAGPPVARSASSRRPGTHGGQVRMQSARHAKCLRSGVAPTPPLVQSSRPLQQHEATVRTSRPQPRSWLPRHGARVTVRPATWRAGPELDGP